MRVEDVPIDVQNQIIRLYQLKIASMGGKASMSREKRSYVTTMNAKRRWAIRRLRYGPSGQRPVDVRLRARLEGGAPGSWRNEVAP